MTTDKRDRILNDRDRLVRGMPGWYVPFKAAYSGIVHDVVYVNAMMPIKPSIYDGRKSERACNVLSPCQRAGGCGSLKANSIPLACAYAAQANHAAYVATDSHVVYRTRFDASDEAKHDGDKTSARTVVTMKRGGMSTLSGTNWTSASVEAIPNLLNCNVRTEGKHTHI